MAEIFTDACRRSISLMLAAKAEEDATAQKNLEKNNRKIHADDNISFEQLLPRNELGGLEDVFESSLSRAIVGSSQRQGLDLGDTKLNKVTQLTGFSDPVYAEAYVNVNQYHKTLKKYSDCLQDTAMNPSSSSLVGAGVVGAGQPSPSLPSAGVKPSGQQP